MTAGLYRWPDRGRVDRNIPKERLYAEAGASARLKQQFIDGVQRIRWAYKIGEESVRLAPVEPVSEFQVFEVELKGADLADAVLKAIDAAVPSPIIFELTRPSGEVQMAAARKALDKAFFAMVAGLIADGHTEADAIAELLVRFA